MVRVASPDDAEVVAALLHDFNAEFETPTPGAEVLTARLRELLPAGATIALLAGDPAVGVALLTLRSNVWFDGRVAVLDELYVRPDVRDRGIGTALLHRAVDLVRERGGRLLEAYVDEDGSGARERFYERHGFTNQSDGQRMLYYEREL
jgi:GNAT superfamily N-acetyltransferase